MPGALGGCGGITGEGSAGEMWCGREDVGDGLGGVITERCGVLELGLEGGGLPITDMECAVTSDGGVSELVSGES